MIMKTKIKSFNEEHPGVMWFAAMMFFIWFTAFINANEFDVSWAWASFATAIITGITGIVKISD
jgi:hypothetical protein